MDGYLVDDLVLMAASRPGGSEDADNLQSFLSHVCDAGIAVLHLAGVEIVA